MPKVSIFVAASLDGFIARPDDDLDWLPGGGQTEDDDEDYGYGEFIRSVDTLVMGRRTFEKVLTFGDWPYGDRRVEVLSTGSPAIPDILADTVRVSHLFPGELLHRLGEEGAEHIYVDGGKTIQSFLDDCLIQKMIITRVPVLLGEGIPLFGRLEREMWWRHVETRTFADGLVQSTYRMASGE